MKERKYTFAILVYALLMLQTGCYNITEFDGAFNGRLQVISSGDFSTVSTISGIPGARSLLIYPGNIFVASTEGVVYRYDSESNVLTGDYLVDSPSPAGFFQMVFNQSANSAYLIGSQGKIIQFSLPDCTVQDVFTVCQAPVALAVAPGNPSYLYVADGSTNTINQISTVNNNLLVSQDINSEIYCIEPGWRADTIIVGTSSGAFLIEEQGPGNLRAEHLGFGRTHAIAAIPSDSNFVIVTHDNVSVMEFYGDVEPDQPSVGCAGEVDIEGITHFLAMGNDWQHAYILSYMGDLVSRLISYNYRSFQIDQQIDVPGFPLDLKVSGSNVIYALTYE